MTSATCRPGIAVLPGLAQYSNKKQKLSFPLSLFTLHSSLFTFHFSIHINAKHKLSFPLITHSLTHSPTLFKYNYKLKSTHLHFFYIKITTYQLKFMQKVSATKSSQAVTHPSTILAHRCLTSVVE